MKKKPESEDITTQIGKDLSKASRYAGKYVSESARKGYRKGKRFARKGYKRGRNILRRKLKSRGRGWRGEPVRHGLAGMGVSTVIDDNRRFDVSRFVARGKEDENNRKIVEEYLEGSYVDDLEETIENLEYTYEKVSGLDLESLDISQEEWEEIVKEAQLKIKQMKKELESGARWIDNDPDFWNDFKPSEWVIQTYTHEEAIDRYKNAIEEYERRHD